MPRDKTCGGKIHRRRISALCDIIKVLMFTRVSESNEQFVLCSEFCLLEEQREEEEEQEEHYWLTS